MKDVIENSRTAARELTVEELDEASGGLLALMVIGAGLSLALMAKYYS